ncbi:acetyl-CoA synthetase [Tibeticola sediminis]|uniref:Acetyl-CoA synthetase n=1 Tax=Tibeticola sediminis TaxID=1917811 RepID=A0A3N4UQ27_9BURK|nr:AMP-binding protein [Tibeticola sediminis]RPE72766.1 acetyl-CoA synthetase [Tibeticola sediminis]
MPTRQARDSRRPLAHPADAYETVHQHLRWLVPERFNIAQVCCRRWAERADTSNSIAIIDHSTLGHGQKYTYSALQAAADRVSHALVRAGVRRGDRVAIVMPQRFETAVAYLSVLQLGAVAVPLSMLFGPEALQFRLQHSDAVLALCDAAALGALQAAREQTPNLRRVVAVGAEPGTPGVDARLEDWLARPAAPFPLADTAADDPAVLIYTSGTTGDPKGALIPHRALIGNLTGFVCSQNWFGFDGVHNAASDAVFWSPADWAWTGGLMDALLPTLYFGRPIVACRERFSPELAFDLLQTHGVTHSFLFPTALKAMMKAVPEPRARFRLRLQALMSAGEAVGEAVYAWCRDALGVAPNEMFGQTEINYIVGNCQALWPAKPGSMGRPYPGHRVAVIDEAGVECPLGVIGEVAVHRRDRHGDPDPVFFLGYWKNEAATRAKFTGDPSDSWCRTGDLALRDADGYLWYQGRADDMFKSAGYRIGPGEIENCLLRHPAVANAAVVPKPDPERGALVKAYVVLTPEFRARRDQFTPGSAAFDAQLCRELQAHVRGRLAPYEYPKEIEFIDQLPMTTTGKVQRRVLRLQEEARARAAAESAARAPR